MKYIKKFENIQTPEVNDYIKFFIDTIIVGSDDYTQLVNFLNNNIGKIVKIDIKYFTVAYTNIPFNLIQFFNYNEKTDKYTKPFGVNNFKYVFGKTPEEVQIQINANKYNL